VSRVTIHWGAAGYTVTCGKLAVVATAMRAVATETDKMGVLPIKPGLAIEMLTIELHAMGHHTAVHVRPGHLLQHVCGHRYTAAEWQLLPAIEQVIPSITGPDAILRLRQCACGSHISYASLTVVAPAVTNAPGGVA
jgi:hypothetical protein